MKKQNIIRYLGFYDDFANHNTRTATLSAVKKMDYLSSVIRKMGFSVEIVSTSWIYPSIHNKYQKGCKSVNSNNIECIYFPSWSTKHSTLNRISVIAVLFSVFFYLLRKVKKNETVLVYHSAWLYYPIKIAKLIKKFKVVLEIGEIYHEIWPQKDIMIKMETGLIKIADSFLLASVFLKETIQLRNRKFIYYHGDYSVYYDTREGKKLKSDYVDIVYAGSIDTTKGGAFNAIKIANFLPKQYRIFILGYGEQKQVIKLEEEITENNSKSNVAECKYLGTLFGEEYNMFLLNCQIAINPQNMSSSMDKGFPTKIISYLAHGLIVISTLIRSVQESNIGEYVDFVLSDDPKDFAQHIIRQKSNIYRDHRDALVELEGQLIDNLKSIL